MQRAGETAKKIAYTSSRFAQPFDPRFGQGGRHSRSGITATVFGSTGFLGRYLCNELGSRGSLCYIPFRGCELDVRHIRQMFDHGMLGLMPFHPRDEQSIRESLRNSDVVINLIGKDYETKNILPSKNEDGNYTRVNYTFYDSNVHIPETIARIAKEEGVKTFIHVSALGAHPKSRSQFFKTKALGEQAVRKQFSDAIIVRPATMFGAEDRFLNTIANLAANLPIYPIVEEGAQRIQPVQANDVATAIMRIINGHEDYKGQTFQLAGKELYTYREAVEYVMDVTGLIIPLIEVPKFAYKLFATGVETGTYLPLITADYVERLTTDVLPNYDDETLLTFEDVGIEPQEMEHNAFNYLVRHIKGGHFTKVSGFYTHEDKKHMQEHKLN